MIFSTEKLTECPSCESQNFYEKYNIEDNFLKHRFNICLCNKCELLFVNPRLSESHMSELYSDSYFHGENWDSDTDYFSNYTREERLLHLEQMYQTHYEHICIGSQINNPKILDAGAGLGFFAQSVLKKYPKAQISCIDFSEYAVNHMINRGLKAKQGLIQDLDPSEKYDSIYCREVIEHLYHPRDFIKCVYNILNPGGMFYYTTGNYNSINDFTIWNYVRPVGHINYFNNKSIEYLFKDFGFRLVPREKVIWQRSKKFKDLTKLILGQLGLRSAELPIVLKP